MSKDINKQIEEEARDYAKHKFAYLNSPLYRDLKIETNKDTLSSNCREDFSKGYDACLHASRWRKVSEGMPPIEEYVLIVNTDGGMRILLFEESDIKDKLDFYCVEYWMPIPERPIGDNQI